MNEQEAKDTFEQFRLSLKNRDYKAHNLIIGSSLRKGLEIASLVLQGDREQLEEMETLAKLCVLDLRVSQPTQFVLQTTPATLFLYSLMLPYLPGDFADNYSLGEELGFDKWKRPIGSFFVSGTDRNSSIRFFEYEGRKCLDPIAVYFFLSDMLDDYIEHLTGGDFEKYAAQYFSNRNLSDESKKMWEPLDDEVVMGPIAEEH